MGRLNFLSFVIFAAVISWAVSGPGVISSVQTVGPHKILTTGIENYDFKSKDESTPQKSSRISELADPVPPVPEPELAVPTLPVPAPVAPVPVPVVPVPVGPEPTDPVPELSFPPLAELGTIRICTKSPIKNQTEEKSVAGSGASDVGKETKSESEDDDDGKKETGREADMSSAGQIQISDARDGSAGAGSGLDARDNTVTILNQSHKKGNHILILNDGYPGKVVIVNGPSSKENL